MGKRIKRIIGNKRKIGLQELKEKIQNKSKNILNNNINELNK